MIVKELKSNKGSTLGLVLITLSVLSMLGIVLISVGLANYRIKMVEERIKTSFYMAESGLEQAYGIILEAVEAAVVEANRVVNVEIDAHIEAEREKERLGIDNPGDPPNPHDSVYIDNNPDGTVNPDGPVNEEGINEAKMKLVAAGGYGWVELFQKTFKEHIDGVPTGVEALNLRLTTLATYKSVPRDADPPSIPSITEVTYISFSETHPDENHLDKSSITLQSSFDFEGTTQTVQMEFVINEPDKIIAGDFTETHVVKIPKSPIWDNALVADNDIKISGSNVTIRGDVFANVEQLPTCLPGCSSEVCLDNCPEVWRWNANDTRFGGIVIGEDSAGDEIDDSSVKIEGNVFTNSFVQIRSTDSTLEITGDTFTNSLIIQDGTDDSTINLFGNLFTSDDIELNGTNATIDINGNFYGFSAFGRRHDQTSSIVINNPYIVSDGSKIDITGNTFLAGVAHVKLTNIWYQTGESVSLRGNFKAYSIPLNQTLRWHEPFALIDDDLLVPDKAAHFLLVNSKHPGFLDAPSAINFGTMKFSEGAFIAGGVVEGPRIPISEGKYLAEKAVDFTNNLTRQYIYSRIFDSLANPGIIESLPAGGEPNPLNLENEIVYITANDVAIIGNGGTPMGIPNETKMPDGQTVLTGIIVTDGNVHIRGNITFRGLIAAKGNIYIEDDNPKLFRTDLGFILRKVHENPNTIGDVFIDANPAEKLTFTAVSAAGAADPAALAQYKGLIEVRSWERIN